MKEKRMNSRCFFVALILMSISSGPARSGQEGWARVTPSDVNQYEDWVHRQKDRSYSLNAVGDFDGDGRQDQAYLAKNVSKGIWGLFLDTSRSGGGPRLVETDEIASLPRVFLDVQPPGRYRTLSCRYGSEPSVNCGKLVDLKTDSFTLTYLEASSRTFFVSNDIVSCFWTSD